MSLKALLIQETLAKYMQAYYGMYWSLIQLWYPWIRNSVCRLFDNMQHSYDIIFPPINPDKILRSKHDRFQLRIILSYYCHMINLGSILIISLTTETPIPNYSQIDMLFTTPLEQYGTIKDCTRCRQIWRCSWNSADRRCSNYIWVINNFIAD